MTDTSWEHYVRIIVIGAGLGGCAAGVALGAVGAEVTVLEAAPEMRREGESISLLANGTAALAALGLRDPPGQRITRIRPLRRDGRPMPVIDTAEIERRTGFPYVVVPRVELLEALESRLGPRIEYGRRVEAVEPTDRGAAVHLAGGATLRADLVVAADGARSAVRAALWPADPAEPFSTAWQGTVDRPADYPSASEVILVMGAGTVTLTLPTTGGRILFFVDDRSEPMEARAATDLARLVERFAGWPGPLSSLLDVAGALRTDEIRLRRPPREWSAGRVVLLGDAAHTLSPSIGQGTNQAFTDAVALADAVRTFPELDRVGPTYTRSRRRRTLALWHASRLVMQPRLFPLMQPDPRVMPAGSGTAAWFRIARPDPLVRRVLARGGLVPR